MKTNKPSAPPRKIRIIGGQYKRSLIPVPDVPTLRPTPDRVRETLFNWVNHYWQGHYEDKNVLDLFAGTGALGFEAASRGAAHVQLVEPNPTALACLRATRDKFNMQHVRIHSDHALKVLDRMDASRFDLILLDPPFHSALLDAVTPHLATIAKQDALIYIESDHPQSLPSPFSLMRSSKAGTVFFHLFQYTEKTDR